MDYPRQVIHSRTEARHQSEIRPQTHPPPPRTMDAGALRDERTDPGGRLVASLGREQGSAGPKSGLAKRNYSSADSSTFPRFVIDFLESEYDIPRKRK